MSRKQATVERIRKRALAPAPPIDEPSNLDPFHNFQIPACRSLVHAVHDVFPELQQQMKAKTPSSEFGRLLRLHILNRRRVQIVPPAPPLAPPSPSKLHNATAAPSKKKRKRKKKKKEQTPSDNVVAASNACTEAEEQGPSHTNPIVYPGSEDDDDILDTVSLQDDRSTTTTLKMEHTVESLDRSLHDLIEAEALQMTMKRTPSLHSLPSDDVMNGFNDSNQSINNEEGHVSLAFFEQIQPQQAEDGTAFQSPQRNRFQAHRQLEREVDTENDVTGSGTQKHHQTPPPRTPPARLRSRTLSGSSFDGAFDGVLAPTSSHDNDQEDDPKSLVVPSSPTHEWVPEDGVLPRKDTSPGEVVKNPLELPYLRTLYTSDSQTTTNINGGLISMEKTNTHQNPKMTSFETTKFLLDEWMSQLLVFDNSAESTEESLELNTFVLFLQDRMNEGREPLNIALADLKASINGIECQSCQHESLEVITKWMERPRDSALVLNPIVLQENTPAHNDTDVDAAFDYVALEEGHHTPKPDPPAEEDGENVDLNAHLSFYVVDSESKKDESKQLQIRSFSRQHLDTLVDMWLPCGVEEEILVSTAVNGPDDGGERAATTGMVLDFNEITKIQRIALEKKKELQDSLEKLELLGKELQTDLSAIPLSNNNFDIVSFPKMQDADKKCTHYSSQILQILKMATLGQTHGLAEVHFDLWMAYLEALNKSLKACDTYYTNVGEQLADQRGVIPKVFVSAEYRTMFLALLEKKVQFWSELGDTVCKQLTNRILKELCTRAAWFSEHDKEKNSSALMLDKKCLGLLHELLGWTDTIMGNRMADIMGPRMLKTESMLESLQTFVEPLAKEYASVEKYFSSERNKYFTSLCSNIGLAQGVKKRMRLIDNAEVEGMATGIVLIWTQVRVMQGQMNQSFNVSPLPLQLKRWLLQDENKFFDEWKGSGASLPTINSYHQHFCPKGSGGKRRAMCTLAGLVYRLLEDQCKVWIAEKAEKELLTNFDSEQPSQPSTRVAMPGHAPVAGKSRKSKKKRSKNVPPEVAGAVAAAASETISDVPIESNGGQDLPVALKENCPDTVSESNGIENGSMVATAQKPETVENTTEDKVEFSGPEVNEDWKSTIVDESSDDDTHTMHYQSTVFVADGQTRISAEEFLVGRLQDVLRQLANGTHM